MVNLAALTPEEITKQLLELHLQHELSCFDEATFMRWLRDESGTLFDWIRDLKLNQLVTAKKIKNVIKRNVVERKIPGAVAEVAGEAATRLFSSERHKATRLNQVISGQRYEEFTDKLLELHEQRNKALDLVIDLPIYRELISDVIYQAIIRYIYDSNILSKSIPGVSSMLKMGRQLVQKTAPKLEGVVEDNVKSYIANNIAFLLHESKTFLVESLTDEQLKMSAMELWDLIENKTLGEFQEGIDSFDLSELIVIGYEFWLRFRESVYFKNCYELVVDYIFEKYGKNKLGVLVDDFAISPERIMEEVELFAPQILETLKSSGQLEQLLRRRLASFYTSDALHSYLSKL